MIETIDITLAEMSRFVPKTVCIMFCSLTLTYIIIKKGFLSYLSRINKPVTYFLRLPEQIAATSVLAFGSALSANVMLSEFQQNSIISEEDAYLGALLNGISVTVKEIFTYQLPVIMPILGLKAGTIYFFCFLSSAIIKYFYIYFYLRFRRGIQGTEDEFLHDNGQRPELQISYKKQMKTFFKTISTYISVTFVILLAVNTGLTSCLEGLVLPINELLRLPSVLVVPVITFIFSPIAGVSAIGSLLSEHAVSHIDAALAVTLGSLLLLPIYSLRGNMSRYISIFGAKLGFKIVITSTALTMLSRIVFILGILIYKGVLL